MSDEKIEKLKSKAAQLARGLIRRPLDVLFFDCTTLYFESFEEDSLKQPGYSKDAKFKESQVLLALLITPEGLPVGYELLPGATYEGHSLIPVVRRLRRQYELRKAVCVADRGMLSEDNLSALEEAGIHYIVGARLKQLPKSRQKLVLNEALYRPYGKDGTSMQEIDLHGRRLIVCRSQRRAEKDRHDRQRALNKLIKKLGGSRSPRALINHCGYKRYLRIEGDAEVAVDQDKIAQSQKWDGLYGVATSLKDEEASAVLSHYRGLWQIEETFRISKHDLRIRPIFHWTPARVRAHIAVCFAALLLVRHMEYRTMVQYKKLSPEVIRHALVRVQYSILRHRKTQKALCNPFLHKPKPLRKLYAMMGMNYSTVPFELTER